VNGQVLIRDGEVSERRPGKLLRSSVRAAG
jgi:hypothetical protein